MKMKIFEGIGLLKRKVFKDPGLPEAKTKKLNELDEWGIKQYNKATPDSLTVEKWNEDYKIYFALMKFQMKMELTNEEQRHLSIAETRVKIDDRTKGYKEAINKCETTEELDKVVFDGTS